MSEIKIIKKKLGEGLIIKPIITDEESENIDDYKDKEFIAVHQMFMDR